MASLTPAAGDEELRDTNQRNTFQNICSFKAAKIHRNAPVLNKLPLPVIAIILAIALVNAGVWVAIGIVLVGLFVR